MKSKATDMVYDTGLGWTIELRELGDDKILMPWGDGHALILDMKERGESK